MGVRAWLGRRTGHHSTRGAAGPAFRPAFDQLEDRSVPAVVGYYDMGLGQGNPTQVAPITASGNTAVLLSDLTAADLTGIDVLFVQNPSNDGYGGEYLSRLASVQAAVGAGMTLIVHDRYVDGADTILPGGAGFDAVRDFSDGSNVDVVDGGTLVTHGPAGDIDNRTLDGGRNSNHGYVTLASLPAGARGILSTNQPGHLVTLSYRYGAGNVIYSSIPLDFYLSGPTTPTTIAAVYAPNVVAYGVSLLNNPPVAGPGTLALDEDTTAAGTLTGTDPGGDPLTFHILAGPRHGTVTLTDPATGAYAYAPAPDYNGPDSFSFTVTDDRGGVASNSVSVTVNPVNDPPVAADDAVGTNEDTPLTIGVLANATDVDGDALAVVAVTQGASGSVTVNADGTVTYTPAANFNGTDSFTYTVADGWGGIATGTVTVTVNPVNDPPAADAGPDVTANEGDPITFTGSATDVDGDPLAFAWDFGDGTTAAGQTVTHTYANNRTYTVTLTVDDGHGGATTDTLTATVKNVPPVVTAGPGGSVVTGSPFTAAGSVSDPGTSPLTATVDYGDGSGVHPLALNPDKTFPLSHVFSTAGTFTVTVCVTDGDGASGECTVPVAVASPTPQVRVDAGPDRTVREGSLVVLHGTFTNPTPGKHQTGWVVENAAHRVVAKGNGAVVTFVTPDDGVYTATFSVRDADGSVHADSAVITATNVAPVVAVLGPTQARPGKSVTFLDGFIDPGAADTHTLKWQVTDAGGHAVASGSGHVLTFKPTTAGTYTVVFTVTDDNGGAGSVTVNLTVSANASPSGKPGVFVSGNLPVGGWLNGLRF